MARTTVHGTLRGLGRFLAIWSVVPALFDHWDAALYVLVLGAVALWQGGFEFDHMGRRYH